MDACAEEVDLPQNHLCALLIQSDRLIVKYCECRGRITDSMLMQVGSDDIRYQLPEKAKRFDRIDKQFMKMMADIAKNPYVVNACCATGRLDQLRAISDDLERLQKSLSDYLDTKRLAFPRFFFLSDEELLSILGSTDPTSIQEHMIKLFDNCVSLSFSNGYKSVTGMRSAEGESLNFREAIMIDGPVEQWMNTVEREMQSTMHAISKEGVYYYAHMPRKEWILWTLGMTAILGSQIWWTWQMDDVFERIANGDKHAMINFAKTLSSQLGDLTDMVRSNLGPLDRKKLNALITIEVHQRDIVNNFVRDRHASNMHLSDLQLLFLYGLLLSDILFRSI